MSQRVRVHSKPKLLTRAMPKMLFSVGVEYPMLYDIHSDIAFLNKKVKYKYYCIAHCIISSLRHPKRFNQSEVGPVQLDAKHCLDNIQLNISVFYLMMYVGSMGVDQIRYVNDVISSWVQQYYLRTGHDPKVDWEYTKDCARYFIPKDRHEFFNRKTRLIQDIVTKRHLVDVKLV